MIAHAATEGGISIHLAAPILGHAFGIPITSTLVMSWLVMFLLITFAFLLRSKLSLVPSKLQICTEFVVHGAYTYVEDALESKSMARKFFPLIATIFIFILTLNWVGLFPGVTSIGIYGESHGETKLIPFFYPANTDLNLTLALALIAFFTIEVAGVAALGFFKYFGKFINFSSPLAFMIGIIELFSELARLVSFSFRLFGNIFAGKTLLVIAMFFVPFIVPVPILAFEMFVGLIQAFIFAVLTLYFIKLAVAEPEH